MLNHLIVSALRALRRHKLHTVIHVCGLSLGIVSAVLILSFVWREKAVNQQFSNTDRIFRIGRIWDGVPSIISPPTIGPLLQNTFSDITQINRSWGGWVIVNAGENSFRESMWLTDSTFFRLFDFPFLAGDPVTALDQPGSIVLTERVARTYFGSADAVGRELLLQVWNGDGRRPFRVTGVIKDPPFNTVTAPVTGDGAQLFVSLADVRYFFDANALESWQAVSFITFVQLDNADHLPSIGQEMPRLLQNHAPEDMHAHIDFQLDALSSHYLNDNERAGQRRIQTLLGLMGIVLLLACINFTTLATAAFSRREKEIGVRKVLGSHRRQLALQFFAESILLSIASFAIGITMGSLLIQNFGTFLGVELTIAPLFTGTGILQLFGVSLAAGLAGGAWPALFLSSFNPVRAMKGGLRSGRAQILARRALVVLQIGIAVFFGITVFGVIRQLRFVADRDPGFRADNILTITSMPREWNEAGVRRQDALKRALEALPEVEATTVTWNRPGVDWNTGSVAARTEWPPEREIPVSTYFVDPDFLGTHELQLAKGRFFEHTRAAADSAVSVVLNETAVRKLELEAAIGASIRIDGAQRKVIGIIRDFNFAPLDQPVEPLIMRSLKSIPFYRYLSLRAAPGSHPGLPGKIRQVWNSFYPDVPMEYVFLSDAVAEKYDWVRERMRISGMLAALAVLIAALGLVGLISFSTSRRRHEIGVRKVHGASGTGMIGLLAKETLLLVLLANAIFAPAAAFYTNQWLADWAFRRSVDFWMLLIPAAASVLIALIVISWHVVRAARTNPVDVLRYE